MNRPKSGLIQSTLTILGKLCTGIFPIFIYLLFILNYVNRNICLARRSFFLVSILYWSLTFLLYTNGSRKILQKQSVFISRYWEWILFTAIPLAAFLVEEIIYNPRPFSIAFSRVLLNYTLYLCLQIGLLLIFQNKKAVFLFILSLAWIFGIANHYVMEFKGNPLLPSDLLAYKTATAVAGNYTFSLSDSMVYGTLLFMFSICLVYGIPNMSKKKTRHKYIARPLLGIAWIGATIAIVYNVNWSSVLDITLSGWDPQESYYDNGALLTFLMEVQELSTTMPESYSQAESASILNEKEQQIAESGDAATNTLPSVIVIMNESFSDLTVLGDFEAEDCLTNWNGIENYIMRGNAYASVIGGGTCNSEFEFLTGNSIANISGSGYPYQMYNFDNVFNLASEFSRYGYETIAIHPENRNNWNRTKVYSQFGFDSFLSLEDIEQPEYIRSFISDKSDFAQVISSYEQRTNPVFIFNVTMQNHGGYDEDSMPENMELISIEKGYRSYRDVVTYMTLIRESDKAFQELLEYFSQVDEPVIICMFGDHQPVISQEFVEELQDFEGSSLESIENRCCVPYIIWSNYDTGVNNLNLDTSLNYLGMNVLEAAGIYSPYSRFLTDIQREIPIINKYGYQTSEGEWKTLDEPNEILNQYSKLQYYMLFDHP